MAKETNYGSVPFRLAEVRPTEVCPAEVRLAEVRLYFYMLMSPLIPRLQPFA
jgi:hypothetical protein